MIESTDTGSPFYKCSKYFLIVLLVASPPKNRFMFLGVHIHAAKIMILPSLKTHLFSKLQPTTLNLALGGTDRPPCQISFLTVKICNYE